VATLLGVAWSPATATLRDLNYFVDLVEAPGWALDEADALQQPRMLLHNLDLNVSLADTSYLGDGWGSRAASAVERTRTPWFSMHLGFSAERVRFDGHMLPLTPPLERGDLLQRVIDSVARAKAQTPVPLLLENLDYCPEGAYEHICDPSFISEVLTATDTGLLLDLGHLQVSASWLGVSPEDMLAQLPLDRVVEVHISSPRPVSDEDRRLNDVHEELTDYDLELLHHLLERTTPRVVVLEYRRDVDQLRSQLLRLGRVLKRRPRPRPCDF
jgi:uncharacterized protein (UPF0276 family)